MTTSGFPLHSDQNPSRSQVAGWQCSPVSPESPCLAYSSSIVIISVSSTPPLSLLSFPPQNISYVVTLQMRPTVLPIPPLLPPHQEHFSSFLKDTKPFPAWRPSSIRPNLSSDDSNQSFRPQFDFLKNMFLDFPKLNVALYSILLSNSILFFTFVALIPIYHYTCTCTHILRCLGHIFLIYTL